MKEKTFLILTTTNDKWEIIGGNYLVIASSSDEAILKIEKQLERDGIIQQIISVVDLDDLEKITSHDYPSKLGGGIFEINSSIVE